MLRWLVVLVCLVGAPEAAADAFTLGQQHYRAGLYDRAYELWLEDAEKGNAHAQYAIGVMHERGQGVEKDGIEAARWLARAAAQGYAPAVQALRALAPQLLEKHNGQKTTAREETAWLPPVPQVKPAQGMFYVDTPPVPALRVANSPTSSR